jgi:hypothetical protein
MFRVERLLLGHDLINLRRSGRDPRIILIDASHDHTRVLLVESIHYLLLFLLTREGFALEANKVKFVSPSQKFQLYNAHDVDVGDF